VATDISEEMRRQVADRANRQCEYSLINEADSGFHHQVDHIVSRKQGGVSTLENLALAGMLCIRHKGTDIASIDSETGSVTRLLNPRQDRWSDRFRIENGRIIPR
jgi:5-methylcytosine-specific restriction endonuclease McrA